VESGKIITNDNEIRDILLKYNTIAVLGVSPKPERDSNRVAIYLKEHGYRMIPVRPAQHEILGEKAYPTLDSIQQAVEIVNVFRNPAQVVPHAKEAIGLKAKVFWMQLGIENPEAADLLISAGIDVVMNKCIKVEHERFFG